MAREHLSMLVDASSLIYRAFFSTPDTVVAPEDAGGMPVNAAHGFLSMLSRLVVDFDPDWLACCVDADWRPQWRVDLIDSYKTHRLADVPDPVEAQMPLIFDLLEKCGVAVVGCDGYEAEDVIGALLPRCPGHAAIVSGDRDLFQLVRDPDVYVLYPKRGVSDLLKVDEAEIESRYGIPSRSYGDFAILRGDPSDGLPGVRGIGEKTAASLLRKFGSLEAILAEVLSGNQSGPLGKIATQIDYLDKAVQVVLISSDVPIGVVDLERPRKPRDNSFEQEAEGLGLLGPSRRLIAALSSSKDSRRR